MPVFGIGLHILVAIFFAIHAIRRGRELYWLLILFMFPLLGSIVYFFAIYLPEIRQSRGAVAATRAVRQAVDPGRGLRQAREAFERTPTVDNRLRLAEALLDSGAVADALRHFSEAAQGPFAEDPALLLGLARAQFANGLSPDCAKTLQRLFAAHPEAKRQPIPALLQARVLAQQNDPAARDAFETALVVAVDPEPKCRFADWLMTQAAPADRERAKALYQEIVADSKYWNGHAQALNREWLQHARAKLNAG
ncbi:MAG: tetratricopeptide repeat protein [Betaproteobacteria bacterium]|nr:tetratricopeptide repeat protein [Betaproteobacteria bacterium]